MRRSTMASSISNPCATEALSRTDDSLRGFAQLDAGSRLRRHAELRAHRSHQCNDMHGLSRHEDPNVSEDCGKDTDLIRRGDRRFGELVAKIVRSKLWSAPGNTAIVVTPSHENDDEERQTGPQAAAAMIESVPISRRRIPTLVITNHAAAASRSTRRRTITIRSCARPRRRSGIHEYLAHAGDSAKGVVTMTPLFAVTAR